MPLVKWACPEGKPTYGEAHEPKFCITECEDKCASPFLIAALTQSVRSNHHKGKYVSATSLTGGCSRKLQLERTIDYADYMKNSFYAYRGTVMHQVVEDAGAIKLDGVALGAWGYLTEWRMLIGYCFEHHGFSVPDTVRVEDESTWKDVSCPGCKKSRKKLADREWLLLGGTLDGLEPLWANFDEEAGVLECKLWDLKTMQDYAVSYFIKGDEKNQYHKHVKDAHFYQANIYKYLAERSAVPQALVDKGVKKIKLVESNIQAFSMGEFPRTGSKYMWKAHYTHDPSLWEIPPVHFKDDAWIEDHINREAREVYETLVKGDRLAKICGPESKKPGEHSWECRFCAFPGTQYCPNPSVEWAALESGKSPEEAFTEAKETSI